MNMLRRIPPVVVAVVICGAPALAQPPAAQPESERVTVAFSDASRPGTLEVELVEGSITVRGEDRKDVAIDARREPEKPSLRQRDGTPLGLRRLTQLGGFEVEEQNNKITIDASNPNRRLNFEIRVPTRTNLKLGTVNSGAIIVEAVQGDLEIENVNGLITLNQIAGSVVATSVNGKVLATLTQLTAQKSMAFTSLNGAVDVALPASTKANLKLRSDNGDVFTDFDIQMRARGASTIEDTRRNGGGRFRLESNSAIYGSINGGGPEIELRTFNGSVFVRKGP